MLRAYWYPIRTRLGLFLFTFFVIALGVAFYTFLLPKTYRATCRIQIEPIQVRVAQIEAVYDPTEAANDFQSRRDFFRTQIENIRGRELLIEVFKRFGFGKKEEFRDTLQPIQAFSRRVSVVSVRNTFLVDISFDWEDAQLAADVANAIAMLYFKRYREKEIRLSSSGVRSLRNQLPQIQQARREALRTLAVFKEKSRLINLEANRRLLVDRMTRLNETMINARVEEVRAKAVLDSIEAWRKNGGQLGQAPEVIDLDSVTLFKLEHLRSQAALLDLLRKYGETHPTVETQKQVVRIMRDAVEKEIENGIGAARLTYQRTKLRREFLATGMRELEDHAFALDRISAEYRILEDEYNAQVQKYQMVMQRITELDLRQQSEDLEAGGNITLVHKAVKPRKHAYPRRGLNLLLGLIAGFVTASGLCLLLDYLDASLKQREEIREIVSAPNLGFVPFIDGDEEERRSLVDPESEAAEAFRKVRTSLGLSFTTRQKRMFMVSSTQPGEGKTLVSVGLAVAFAEAGQNVLLLECDMRRPRMKHIFAQDLKWKKNQPGLSSVLVDAVAMEDVVRTHPDLPTLHIAPAGIIPPNPSELLASENFNELLETLLETYDMVLLDVPPVLNVADSSTVASMGIPVVYVVRAFETDRRQASHAIEQLRTVQAQVIGTVINNADANARKLMNYGYRYQYQNNY